VKERKRLCGLRIRGFDGWEGIRLVVEGADGALRWLGANELPGFWAQSGPEWRFQRDSQELIIIKN
jgi:hypothetical protein